MRPEKLFAQKLKLKIGEKQDRLPSHSAVLGDGNGNLFTGSANKVYISIAGNIEIATCTKVMPKYGLRVRVGRSSESPNLYQVLAVDGSDPLGNGATIGMYADAERYRHLSPLGGEDPLWLEKRAWLPLRVGMTNPVSLYVYVNEGTIWDGTAYKYIASQTVDLTAHVPSTTGKAALVSIVAMLDGTIETVKGDEVDIADLVPAGDEYLNSPDLPAGAIYDVLAYVRVYYGQTAIQEGRSTNDGSNRAFTDFIDVRGMYRNDYNALSNPVNHLTFSTSPADVPDTDGTVSWNDEDKTLDVNLPDDVTGQLFLEDYFSYKNQTGSTLTNGMPLMFAGTLGASGILLAQPAIADNTLPPEYIIGIATHDTLNGEMGKATWRGKVRGIDTTGAPYGETWADGDLIWVSPTTAGHLTNIEPDAPDRRILVAAVVYADDNVGELMVRPTWTPLLEDLDDVDGGVPGTGSILVYNDDEKVWSNYPTFASSSHYTGFPDRTSTALSWDDVTYTLTLTASADKIWINGVEYSIDTLTKTLTVAQEAATGLYWFWITAPLGVPQLNCDITPPGFDKCLTATVYWNTTTSKGIISDERHWMGRDKLIHEYLHETVGARYASGMAGTFTDTTISIGGGEYYDEDIEHLWVDPITTVRVLYKNGDSDWAWDTLTTPYKVVNPGVDNNLRYNNVNALATVDNNKYVNQWVYAVADVDYPIHVLIGTAQYTTLALARAAVPPSFGSFASAEHKLIYKLTYQNNGGTPDYIEATDYRTASSLPTGTYVATDHGTLAGLTDLDHPASAIINTPAGNIAATTVQAAIDELDSEKAGLALANTFTAAQKINVNSTTALFVEQDGVKDNVLVVDTTNGGVGINGVPGANSSLYPYRTFTNTVDVSGALNTVSVDTFFSPAASSAARVRGLRSTIVTSGTAEMTGSITGLYGQARHQGSGTLALAQGLDFSVDTSSGILSDARGINISLSNTAGQITRGYGYLSTINVGAGTSIAIYGMYLNSNTVSGAGVIQNNYGLRIFGQTVGTSANYAIYTAEGLNRFGDQISIVGSADRNQFIVTDYSSQTGAGIIHRNSSSAISNQFSTVAGVSNVINESGADIDTRIESDNYDALFIDASNNATHVMNNASGKISFFGATAVTKQTELTDELTTLTFTAPGTPDYAIQDLVNTGGYGFVTKDEGNTVLSVIANLQTRVNELETKLVAYGLLADAD